MAGGVFRFGIEFPKHSKRFLVVRERLVHRTGRPEHSSHIVQAAGQVGMAIGVFRYRVELTPQFQTCSDLGDRFLGLALPIKLHPLRVELGSVRRQLLLLRCEWRVIGAKRTETGTKRKNDERKYSHGESSSQIGRPRLYS